MNGWDIRKANEHARRRQMTEMYSSAWQRLRSLLPRIDWSN